MSLSPPPLPSPPPPPPPADFSSSSASHLIPTLSYDIFCVLLLHLYRRWFLVRARRRSRRSRASVIVPGVLTSRLHQRFTIIDTANSDHSNAKLGLPFSIIASIPLFVYKIPSTEGSDHGSECAICLSVFEEEEIGRKLPGCGHAFHVECIDTWLHSHSTCPICRRAVEITDPNHNSTDLPLNNEDESN